MKTLTLNIYGENDEIIKTYETSHIRWRLFSDAIKLNEEIKDKDEFAQLEALGEFIKNIFLGLTDEELKLADAFDIFNNFKIVINMANAIKGGARKNA